MNVSGKAKEIALASEIIIEGSLNIFAHPTNVDLLNRITVLDLYEMGEQLRPTGLTVGLETIRNRVIQNRKRGVYTWVFIDECYLFFRYHYSAQFLYRAWKRFRKYGAPMTAATQNVEECLNSETARLMLANSEFLLLYNQASTDRAELAKVLNISQTQMSYIAKAPPDAKAAPVADVKKSSEPPKAPDNKAKAFLRKTQKDYEKAEKDLQRLKSEIVNALTGASAFSPELLNSVIQEQSQRCEELRNALTEAEKDYAESDSQIEVRSQQYDDLLEWSAAYETASISAKKVIVARMIERVDVYRGYQLKLKLNISVEQFLVSLENIKAQEKKSPA